MKMHTLVDRNQSRQSQLLNISKWLRNSNDNDCYAFLEKLRNELNHQSIGSLIAALIVKIPFVFTNENLDHLSIYCHDQSQQEQHWEKEQKIQETQNIDSAFNGNTIASHDPTTLTTPPSATTTSAKQDCHALLSLSNDSFSDLARYLARLDAISLGLCCHRLYQATQTFSFLSNIGYGDVYLTGHSIQRIYDFKSDPWMYFVNCKHLTLGIHTNTSNTYSCPIRLVPGEEKLQIILTELMKHHYYNNWFSKMLFSRLESLTFGNNGFQLLSCLSSDWAEWIFGLKRLNKHTNGIEMRNQPALRLVFQNSKIQEFLDGYNDYFVKCCESKIENIRKIGVLEIKNADCYDKIADSISKYLKPNYNCFRCNDGVILINSLLKLNNLFHCDLHELDIEQVQIENGQLMHDIYIALGENGFIFSLADLINDHNNSNNYDSVLTNDDIEFIRNDEHLMHEMNIVDEQLSNFDEENGHFESLFGRMLNENCNYNKDKNYDVYHLPYSKEKYLYRAYFVSICQWMNQCLDNIINKYNNENGNNCNQNENENVKMKEKKVKKNNKQRSESATALKILRDIVTKPAQIQRLKISERDATYNYFPWGWEHFNSMMYYPVVYRLLNFGNTVEHLSIQFVARMMQSSDYDRLCKNHVNNFDRGLSNIFEHFQHAKKVEICINFGTLYKNHKLENVINSDSNNIRTFTIQEMMDAVSFYTDTYVKQVINGVNKYYNRLKQRGFCMMLYVFVGKYDVNQLISGNISHWRNIEHELMDKGLIDCKLSTISEKTTFHVYDKDDIQVYTQNVIQASDRIKKLIKNCDIRENLYRSRTYTFCIHPNTC